MRATWDEYFMQIAQLVATRSTCLRRKVGCVLVKDKHILATGYNGVPSGLEHCETVGCLRQQLGIPSGERHELCRATHAEQNALVQAARFGTPIEGATVYCTALPCAQCAKMLINAKVERVLYLGEYLDALGSELFREAGITLSSLSSSKSTEQQLPVPECL